MNLHMSICPLAALPLLISCASDDSSTQLEIIDLQSRVKSLEVEVESLRNGIDRLHSQSLVVGSNQVMATYFGPALISLERILASEDGSRINFQLVNMTSVTLVGFKGEIEAVSPKGLEFDGVIPTEKPAKNIRVKFDSEASLRPGAISSFHVDVAGIKPEEVKYVDVLWLDRKEIYAN